MDRLIDDELSDAARAEFKRRSRIAAALAENQAQKLGAL
jgi:hypothetical protein